MYIVFEGVIGTGKTTQSKKIAEYLKIKFPNKKVVWTKEPGGTEIADEIRHSVQAKSFNEEMEPMAEALLYAASRAQSLRQVVMPILLQKGVVVSDRSFITSLANQAFGRELPLETVMQINKIAVDNTFPDAVIYLDLDYKIGMNRAFDKNGDKFEGLGDEFYKKVTEGYKKISEMSEFKNKWINIDASGSEDDVYEKIKNKVEELTKVLE